MHVSSLFAESTSNVVQILNLGAIGLGFLLAVMAYQLLRVEQRLPKPRRSVLNATYVFMAFSLTLTSVGFVSEYLRQSTKDAMASRDNDVARLTKEAGATQDELKASRERLAMTERSLSTLRERVNRVLGSLQVAQMQRGVAIEGLSEEEANRPAIKQIRAQLTGIQASLKAVIDNLSLDAISRPERW